MCILRNFMLCATILHSTSNFERIFIEIIFLSWQEHSQKPILCNFFYRFVKNKKFTSYPTLLKLINNLNFFFQMRDFEDNFVPNQGCTCCCGSYKYPTKNLFSIYLVEKIENIKT